MAPEFTLPWATRDSVGPADAPFRLGHARGKVVVLAFFPKDFTSGCTAEMRTFADQYATMFGDEVVVVGISVDSVTTHVSFAQSLQLPFQLLSDPAQAVAKKYGSQGSGSTCAEQFTSWTGTDGWTIATCGSGRWIRMPMMSSRPRSATLARGSEISFSFVSRGRCAFRPFSSPGGNRWFVFPQPRVPSLCPVSSPSAFMAPAQPRTSKPSPGN
jgi:peroxiredoxin